MPRLFSGRVIFYLIFLLVVDFCLMPLVRSGIFFPVLLYLMVPYAAFVWRWEKTTALALVIGLLRDLTVNHPFGIETIAVVVTAHFLDIFVHKVERDAWAVRFMMSFLFLLSVGMLILVIEPMMGGRVFLSWGTFLEVFKMAVSTTFVMPVVFFCTALFFRDRAPIRQYELFG
ncbi:MAG: hypothetical protein JW893_08620 [Candidatus Omnitrophica bacterium]|nr:hypothetical protein [Candidatus Omnitrophota bacterium]